MRSFDIAVVGSGVGLTLVEAALQNGKTCALVEESRFGGTCLNRGCIPSKILVHPADLIREAQKARDIGLTFPQPELNWHVVGQRLRDKTGMAETIESGLDDTSGLTLFRGTGTFTGPKELRVTDRDGSTQDFRADVFIIACGARSSVPPIPGLEETGYITSETFFGSAFPDTPWKRLVILGGGAIGTEFAHIFSAAGSKVTLVERLPGLVPAEEPEIRTLLADRLRAVGVDVCTGCLGISARREGSDRILSIRNEDSGIVRDIPCDAIFVSSGIRSNADRLHVERAGIETDSRGWIRTDEYLRTNVPDVYALGDINGKYQFRHKANYEADILVGNLFSDTRRPVDYSAIPWAIFTHPQIAHVGQTEQQVADRGYPYFVGYNHYSDTANGYATGYLPGDADDGFIKLLADRDRKILGVHIIGPQAAALIQPFVYLMNAGIACPECPEPNQRTSRILPDRLHTCLDIGVLHPEFESLAIHPSISEVAAWVIGNLERRDPTS